MRTDYSQIRIQQLFKLIYSKFSVNIIYRQQRVKCCKKNSWMIIFT